MFRVLFKAISCRFSRHGFSICWRLRLLFTGGRTISRFISLLRRSLHGSLVTISSRHKYSSLYTQFCVRYIIPLQVYYFGHLRKTGGRGSYRLVHAAQRSSGVGLKVLPRSLGPGAARGTQKTCSAGRRAPSAPVKHAGRKERASFRAGKLQRGGKGRAALRMTEKNKSGLGEPGPYKGGNDRSGRGKRGRGDLPCLETSLRNECGILRRNGCPPLGSTFRAGSLQ